MPNVTTAFLTPDFNSLTTIIASLSLDVSPAFSNVVVTFDLSNALKPIGAATVTSGNVSSSAGQLTWTLPTLGSTKVTLSLTQQSMGQNGTWPLFDAIQYNVGNGAVGVPVPTIDIAGCPTTMVLNPPSATHTIGQNHTATLCGARRVRSADACAVRLLVVSGPNAGLQFNSTLPLRR